MTEVTYTFRLERELREAFVEMAEAQDMTAAQILRRMIRDAVDEHREALAHENWTRDEIGSAMNGADDADTSRLPPDAVENEWDRLKRKIRHHDDK
ncbi:hypothetical protein SAMN05518668_101359 [Sphingobium sp. YR657]|uniref:hypothetical protein n=1 Tax=Sphingobium sp. YR657 TaxID=1884366 RepID=UPI00091479A7|nr:hypothetical protein [Sphingobium sp. YR657]SHL51344.1 hypothetical protein SAMN05518668_101359 [Sphingobium sp. YR657]